MCGIAGILEPQCSREQLEGRLLVVQRRLAHRGPDSQGLYAAPDAGVGLVHTRLSILDLSAAGSQPMWDDTGRYLIVFNGEIYNFAELRQELEAEGETFRSRSDTEVILKMYRRYGANCVREFSGMFAFAIWDSLERTCFFARDALGIKPLYYHLGGRTLAFASELRALLEFEHIPRRLDHVALEDYFLFGSVQEPATLVAGVHSLPAGHYMIWQNGSVRSKRYWEIQYIPEPIEELEAVKTVRKALRESVSRHFVSDVPVGIFLSGGIDSTALVALARDLGHENVSTFCISFDDARYNEGDAAARTASHFGTQHIDWRLTAQQGRLLLQEFLACSDQPSIDGFNTYCVSRLAHDQGAKVVLSGLGGDEIFGGYQSFDRVPGLARINRLLSLVGPVKRGAARLLVNMPLAGKYLRLASYFGGMPSAGGAYWCMRGVFTPDEADTLAGKYINGTSGEKNSIHFGIPIQPTPEDEVSYLELTRYMRNQLLRDSDIMSMAVGLELRVPFVNRLLLDTVGRIPASLRLAKGKNLLVRAVPELPDWVLNSPKRGFSFPFDHWLLSEWGDIFQRIDAESPVPLHTWYRRWCIFALENFLQKTGIG